MFNQKSASVCFAFFLALCSLTLSAQRAHVVYAEVAGNALFYSANYDVRFAKSGKGLGLRIGISPTSDGVITPVQLNYVTGEKHALEIGAGILTGFDKEVAWGYIPNASVMYRFQGARGFNFRIGWTPTFLQKGKNENSYIASNALFAWGGLSLGYRF